MSRVFALDVDGIVLDILPGAIEHIRSKYGLIVDEADFTDWDWDYVFSLPGGLTPEFWYGVWATPGVPYPGAIEFVQDLKDDDWEVVAISTRPENWKGLGRMARDAADRDFPQIGFDRVFCVDRHKQKVEVVNDLDASYMVEDNPKNAMEIGMGTTVVQSYLFTRPWNARSMTVNKAWERVSSYEELLNHYRFRT